MTSIADRSIDWLPAQSTRTCTRAPSRDFRAKAPGNSRPIVPDQYTYVSKTTVRSAPRIASSIAPNPSPSWSVSASSPRSPPVAGVASNRSGDSRSASPVA